ncbi:chorismate mutase [Helcococcus kunzii]|uniref:chorismate mutase n=1 Tax=Helcococcus kunzii TaxID=40091 RepID=UPI001BAFBBE5|nr:chorismate mutase [Helcococcus kunzii]MCT1796769.1 chorismate mutase [Helcococcus kunzii]MCT1988843.1 chorismate mutase [Helcococcus kunzii]QUY64490.1 chorismate mutase [Helcococcus kunzii]
MLEKQREKIDEIDKEIVRLFEERMKVVVEVAQIKKENNLEIFDSSRENLVIEKVKKYLENEKLKKYLEEFYKDLMNLSKKYQKDIINK